MSENETRHYDDDSGGMENRLLPHLPQFGTRRPGDQVHMNLNLRCYLRVEVPNEFYPLFQMVFELERKTVNPLKYTDGQNVSSHSRFHIP